MSDTGSPKERELVSQLNEEGYGAIRMAASGAGGSLELPDIFYHVNGYNVAGEMKYAGDGNDYSYIGSDEITDLKLFAERWNAIPIAINRWARDTNFYVIPLRSVSSDMLTRSGNLSMKKDNRDQYMEIMQYNQILEKS